MSETESAPPIRVSAAETTARVALETVPSVPILGGALEDLHAMVAAEVAGAQTAEEGDALRVRAALLAWDGLSDRARALDALADAEHPLAPVLRLGLGQLPDRGASTASEVDQVVTAAHQFARGAYAEAAELAELAGPIAALVRRVALGLLGAWQELVRDAERDDGNELLEEASAVALDRLADPGVALALLRRLYEAGPHPYVIERLLELRDEVDVEGILRAKLQRIEPAAAPERAASLYLLASALEEKGNEAEAEGHLSALIAAGEGAAEGLPMLSLRALARLGSKRGDWHRAAEAWEALARDSGSPTFAGAYLRRAAELWDARVGAADRAEPIYVRLHEADPGDAALATALVRLLLRRGATSELGAVLGRLGGSCEEGTQGALLLAASIEELGGGDPAKRRAYWHKWADAVAASRAESAEAARAHALEGIARGLRGTYSKSDSKMETRAELIEHYRTQAPALDAVRGAAYLAVAGALALEEGLTDIAAALFDEAASREPNDLLVHAGRAILFERTGRHAELATALQALTHLVESTTAQATLHKKLAKVSVERLNDVATAHESYERLLEIEPENVTVIEAFVRLCAEGGKWARAIELIDRGAALAGGERAAAMLCYAGELTERHRSDDDAALAYYERALERSRKHAGALAGLAAQHKKFNRLEPYLVALKALLDLDPPRERRIELLLEYARGAERADGAAASHDYGRAFASYDEVLRLEPAQPIAMQGLERLCRASARWEELAEAYARAPESLRGVRVRAECMEHLERWGELAKVRETELRLLEAPAEIAAAARSLAELYESRLHNPEAAVRAWMRVTEAAPTEAEPLRAVARLHEAAGRHPALAAALERELALGEVLEVGRRIELWTRLGELRRGPLASPATAAEAFEEALRLDPRRPEVVEQLIELYKSLGRGNDLSRMLDARAATANNPQQRANVIREKAELCEREGDVPGALQAYQQAFSLDPESRACFTAYEKLCYKAEHWKQALVLYEAAIALVEEKKSRAYRLADLYARRGQLQLQYLGALGEATASYKRVLDLDPENDVSQTALERIFSTQSDWRGLIAVYEHRAELIKTDARRVEMLRRAARVAAAKLHDAAEAARLYERLHAVDPTDAEATRYPRALLRARARHRAARRHLAHAPHAHRWWRRGDRAAPAHRAAVRGGPPRRRAAHRCLPEDPRDLAIEPRGDRCARPSLRRNGALGRAGRGHPAPDPPRHRPRTEGAPVLQVRLGHGVEVREGRRRDPLLRRGDQDLALVLARGARPARSLSAPAGVGARHPDAGARGQALDRGQGARRGVRAHRPDLRRAARRSRARHPVLRDGAAGRSRVSAGEQGAVRSVLRRAAITSRRSRSRSCSRRRSRARAIPSSAASSTASARSSPSGPAICAPPSTVSWSRWRSAPTTSKRSTCS